MNRISRVRRLAAALAGLAAVLVAFAVSTPAAFAKPLGIIPPPPGWNKHPPLPPGHWTGPVYKIPVHTVVIGGMPGWQITLIAAGAALLAAVLAVLADRARATRRRITAPAA
jgi:hypothetical protein